MASSSVRQPTAGQRWRQLHMVGHMTTIKAKPSASWRSGFMLYQGWPAQEGGTDSNREASSSSDIFLPREVVAHGVTSARPEVPLPPRVPWPNRYPAWWTEMSVPEPTPKAKASSPTEAEAQPTARCPTTSKAAAAAATEPAATEPTACAPAATTVATQTQTSVTRATVASRPARSPLMPCMRNAPPSRKKAPTAKPRVESIVALQLRREAAYRKQLAAARRRRLEAVVSGLDLDEETAISSEERGPANRVRAFRDVRVFHARSDDITPRRSNVGASASASWSVAPSRRHRRTVARHRAVVRRSSSASSTKARAS